MANNQVNGNVIFRELETGKKFKVNPEAPYELEKVSESTVKVVGAPEEKRNLIGSTKLFDSRIKVYPIH